MGKSHCFVWCMLGLTMVGLSGICYSTSEKVNAELKELKENISPTKGDGLLNPKVRMTPKEIKNKIRELESSKRELLLGGIISTLIGIVIIVAAILYYIIGRNDNQVMGEDREESAPVCRIFASRIQRRRPEVTDRDMEEIRRAINEPAAQDPVIYRRAPNADDVAVLPPVV